MGQGIIGVGVVDEPQGGGRNPSLELAELRPDALQAPWHNGQSADVPGAFEQNWHLMSTREIADAKKELDAQPHEGWQHAWVPFLDDDNGNYLCLDLGSPGHPVRECWRGRSSARR